jgi:hypothetical protein
MAKPSRFPLALAASFAAMFACYAAVAAAGYWYWGDAASPLAIADLAANSWYSTASLPVDRLLVGLGVWLRGCWWARGVWLCGCWWAWGCGCVAAGGRGVVAAWLLVGLSASGSAEAPPCALKAWLCRLQTAAATRLRLPVPPRRPPWSWCQG